VVTVFPVSLLQFGHFAFGIVLSLKASMGTYNIVLSKNIFEKLVRQGVLWIRNKSFGSGFGSGSGLKLVSNADPKHLLWFGIESGTGNKFRIRIESGSGNQFRIRLFWFLIESGNGKKFRLRIRNTDAR
jgi:hypothetical protein